MEPNFSFQISDANSTNWALVAQSEDCTCFHTKEWMSYLTGIGIEPFIVSIKKDDVLFGCFLGVRRWFGVKTIGAPTDGTGTYTQGLCLFDKISIEERIILYKQLWEWVKKCRFAHYMQICDWGLRNDNAEYTVSNFPLLENASIHYQPRTTLLVDTRKTEEELWSNLHYKSCKYSINKARKAGLYVKQITKEEDIAKFVDVHFKQIQNVCGRKGMRPQPYQQKKHLVALCKSLFPNHIFMLQVMGNDEKGQEQCMSSAIFCPGKAASTYFTGASFQQYMRYCPNELMVWEAMSMLHKHGAGNLIFGGVAHYKTKFGSAYTTIPMMVFSRHKIILNARQNIKKAYSIIREAMAKIILRS